MAVSDTIRIMKSKETPKKISLLEKPNLMKTLREIPHGFTGWLSPDEMERDIESVRASLNKVSKEFPSEYRYEWNEEERAFLVERK